MALSYKQIAQEVLDRLAKSIEGTGGTIHGDFIEATAYAEADETEYSPTHHVHAVDVEFPSTLVAVAWTTSVNMESEARFRDAPKDMDSTVVVTFPLLAFAVASAWPC